MKRFRRIRKIILPILALCILMITAGCNTAEGTRPAESGQAGARDGRNQETLLSVIDSYRGFIRTVSSEEMEFYRYFVERDLPEKVDEETLQELTKSYAGEINAMFYLGNRLGICEPFSFEALKLRMEQENELRKLKLEQGEAVYGLEKFTLEYYFQYVTDNLQADLENYLEANADEEILKLAEAYYDQNADDFIYRKEVVYEQTLAGKSETLTADVDLLSLMGKNDTALADFLQMSEIGEVYEDFTEEGERRVVLKAIVYSDPGYENNREMVLYRFIREQLYADVIETVKRNNPAEFEIN